MIFATVAAAFLITSCFAAEVVNQNPENLTQYYNYYRLANGLDVIIHRHDQEDEPMKASLTVGVGSSNVSKSHPVLTQTVEGLAHLLEHCIFYANDRFTTPFSFEKYSMSSYRVDLGMQVHCVLIQLMR